MRCAGMAPGLGGGVGSAMAARRASNTVSASPGGANSATGQSGVAPLSSGGSCRSQFPRRPGQFERSRQPVVQQFAGGDERPRHRLQPR